MATIDTSNVTPPPSPGPTLIQMIRGCMITQLIYVAAKLGIADLMQDGPKSATELANLTGTHAPSLYRVLRALSNLDIFAENENGSFELTPMAALLRSNVPGSLRGSALVYGGQWGYEPFGELLHSVKTGQPAFDHVHGQAFFDYLNQDPEASRIFNEHMVNATGQDVRAVLEAYDFSKFKTVVDVGGGHGALITAILKTYGQMRGILVDAPSVVQSAKETIEEAGVKDRCQLTPGDFFQEVPGGGDAYTLKDILHDWRDEEAVRVLKSCHRAMDGDGKLLVLERVIPPVTERSFGKLVDITMLVLTGGLERTASEYETLLVEAGFKVTNVVPTRSPVCIVEAVPVS